MQRLPVDLQLLVLDQAFDFLDYDNLLLIKKCILTVNQDTDSLPLAFLSLQCSTFPMEARLRMMVLLCDQNVPDHLLACIKRTFFLDTTSAEYLLLYSCEVGNTRVAQWVSRLYKVQNHPEALLRACSNDRLETAEWLLHDSSSFCTSPEDRVIEMFVSVCRRGSLRMAKWIVAKKSFLSFVSFRSNDKGWMYQAVLEGFKQACSMGHMHIVEWLFITFPITKEGHFFYCACASGRLPILKWILDRFPSLSWHDLDPSQVYKNAKAGTLRAQSLDLIQWLSTTTSHLLEKDRYNFDMEPLETAIKLFYQDFSKWLLTREDDAFVSSYREKAFLLCCIHGNLELLQWMLHSCSNFKLPCGRNVWKAFHYASAEGHLHVLKWLKSTIHLDMDDALASHAFEKAAIRGHLHIVEWMPPQVTVVSSVQSLLRSVCSAGQLMVLQTLVQRFQYTRKNFLADQCELLLHACDSRYPETVRWLVNHFQVTIDDLRFEKGFLVSLLLRAISVPNLQLLQWLTKHFSLTYQDIVGRVQDLILSACQQGALMPQWLVQHFQLGRKHLEPLVRDAFYFACYYGHVQVAEWISSQFHVTLQGTLVFSRVAETGRLHVLKWLAKKFRLTSSNPPPDLQRAWDRCSSSSSSSSSSKLVTSWLASHFKFVGAK